MESIVHSLSSGSARAWLAAAALVILPVRIDAQSDTRASGSQSAAAGLLGPDAAVVGTGVSAPGRSRRATVGKVAGRVTDGVTGEALVGGQVTVRGLPLGNLSDEAGAYHINNIPVGTHAIVVDYLGYESQSQALRVEAGASASLDFAMTPSPIEAEEIVVEEEVVRDLSEYVERTPAPTFATPKLRQLETEESDTTLMEEWHRSMREGATVAAIEYPMQGTRVYYRRPAPKRRRQAQAEPAGEAAPPAQGNPATAPTTPSNPAATTFSPQSVAPRTPS